MDYVKEYLEQPALSQHLRHMYHALVGIGCVFMFSVCLMNQQIIGYTRLL